MSHRRPIVSTVLALVLVVSSLYGETTSIRGRVVGPDGKPVANATVACLGPGGQETVEVRTDADGRFDVAAERAGSASELRISAPGFRSQTVAVSDLAQGEGSVSLETGLQEHVAVTALRQERELFNTPQSMLLVTRENMDAAVVQTTPGAVETTGIQVQRTDLGGGTPYLRGMLGNQVMLMVDGVPLNNSTYRLGPLQYLNTVDPFAVSHIEVLRGPTSSLYGSGGLGGAVNVMTNHAGAISGLALTTAYDSATEGPSAALRGGGTFGRFSVTGGVSGADFGDLEAGGETGEQIPTGYDRQAADAKLSWQLNQGSTVSAFGHFYEADEVPRYDRIASGADQYHFFDPQRMGMGYVQYQRASDRPAVPTLSATLSRVVQTEGRRILAANSTNESLERDEVVTDGLGVQLTWAEWRRQVWTAGVEVYADDVSSTRVQHDLTTGAETPATRGRFPDGATYNTAAAYALNSLRATDRLDFHLGVRYSRFDAEALVLADSNVGVVESNYDAEFGETTGSAYFLFRATPRFNVTGGIAQGFRAPGLDDATIFGEFNAGWEVPNPDLAPEQLLSYELSGKVNGERTWASITAFDSHIEDLIVRAPGTYQGSSTYLGEDVFQRTNVGEARIYGAEAELRFWPIQRLTLSLVATATRGNNETADTPLQRMPPLAGRFEATWRPANPSWWLSLTEDFANDQDRLSPQDLADTRIPPGGTPGYGVTSLGAGFARLGDWQASFVLYNVFDKEYRVHGSGIDGPGRSVRALLRYSWDRS